MTSTQPHTSKRPDTANESEREPSGGGTEQGQPLPRTTSPTHALSVDVECYYQIVWKDYLGQALEPTEEVLRNTNYLLDRLAEHGTRATFFVLGNVARRYPKLVRRMADEGVELAVHGDEHHQIWKFTPSSFHDALHKAIDSIEQAAGTKVYGHRAAAFSIIQETRWALDVIAGLDLLYDSSIFPIRGRRYGIPDTPVGIHRLPNGLFEVPLTVVNRGKRRLPALGGGYFRVFPYQYSRWALRQCEVDGRPAITYFHPHEFELSKPQVTLAAWRANALGAARLLRFSATQGLGRGHSMRRKFERMLREHKFEPIRNLLPR